MLRFRFLRHALSEVLAAISADPILLAPIIGGFLFALAVLGVAFFVL